MAEVAHLGWLGYVILAIVMGSLFFIILAAVLSPGSNPRSGRKVSLLFITTVIGLFVAVVVGMWAGGLVFSVLMG
jgi:hypothetical protein